MLLSSRVPAAVFGACSTVATPSDLSCRIDRAALSSYGMPRRMNSLSTSSGGSGKTPTRVAIPRRTRSAASRTPAPSAPTATTMMSAGSTTGSSTTRAEPAACNIGVRTAGTPTIAAQSSRMPASLTTHLSREGAIACGVWSVLAFSDLNPLFVGIYTEAVSRRLTTVTPVTNRSPWVKRDHQKSDAGGSASFVRNGDQQSNSHEGRASSVGQVRCRRVRVHASRMIPPVEDRHVRADLRARPGTSN